MPLNFAVKYPAEARNTYWQKKKTFKDKTHKATKTGLGPTLDKAEKAWNAIPFKHLDALALKAKSVQEAEDNLARARTIQTTQVKAARGAIVSAMKTAQATAKNTALSPAAVAAAKVIEQKLHELNGHLLHLTTEDFKKEVARTKAARSGAQPLFQIAIKQRGGSLGEAAKGQINADRSVSLAGIRWNDIPQDKSPQDYKNTTVTVDARQQDNSIYLNDMTLAELSTDGTRAKLR